VIATQHLDVAYLWKRHPDGEALMQQCFERVIQVIEAYPDVHFVFSRSTAWSFYTIEIQHRELFEQVKRYVDLGRIELCGGQWVEPDNILSDGETLVRQSLYGQGYFQSRFGKRATVGWNPDAFAHGNTLPQILAQSGLEGYYFHRCQPLDNEGKAITQFIWEGLDGSRVFALCGKWRGKPCVEDLQECVAEMERAGLNMDFVVTGANSDRRVTLERDWVPALQAANDEPGLPPARWATAGDVLADMRATADRLPIVVGELGFQFTGTYTSEGTIKRRHRRAEALLADAEKTSVCAMLLGHPYPRAELDETWRDLCVNAFHDIVCGTCYQHVHQEAHALYDTIEARGRRIQQDALQFIASCADTAIVAQALDPTGRPFVILNTLSWPRRAPVTFPLPAGTQHDLGDAEVVARDGRVVPAQVIALEDGSHGLAFVPPDELPALGYTVFALKVPPARLHGAMHAVPRLTERALHLADDTRPIDPSPSRTSVGIASSQRPLLAMTDVQPIGTGGTERGLVLENETLLAQVDPGTGALCRLYDKTSGTELLAPGTLGNRLVFYEDRSELSAYEPWYIGYTGRTLGGGQVVRVRRVEDGPVRACIRVERTVPLHPDLPPTEIVQDILLYKDLPYLVFQTRGNWQAERVLLKAEFDFVFACTRLACEMPYGVVERRPHRGQTAFRIGRDAAGEDGIRIGTAVEEPDRPMQKWLDFTDGTRGVAILNNGRYGYDASDRQVRISLLRAPIHRDGETIGLGPFSFSYALLPHRGDWRAARLPQWGYAFNHDLVPAFTASHAAAHAAAYEGLAPEGRSFYSVQDPRVLITAAKLAKEGDGVVLRLYQSSGQPTVTRLTSAIEIAHVAACDLLETPLADASGCRQVSSHAVEVLLGPFEIKTLLLQHKDHTGT